MLVAGPPTKEIRSGWIWPEGGKGKLGCNDEAEVSGISGRQDWLHCRALGEGDWDERDCRRWESYSLSESGLLCENPILPFIFSIHTDEVEGIPHGIPIPCGTKDCGPLDMVEWMVLIIVSEGTKKYVTR